MYFDFNVQHFQEKLREVHGITQSYMWVKTALQELGLISKRKKTGSHRNRRSRRPLPGIMLHGTGEIGARQGKQQSLHRAGAAYPVGEGLRSGGSSAEINTFKAVYEQAAALASECAKGRPESLPNKTSATYRT